ncbi:MAG: CvpA family protein [Campylobacterales bacterium]|nr:CvpA family protein [Campylobacterales bacterium]
MIEHIDYNNLNYLDITIITLIAILALKGFVNGFIKEFFGAVGLVGGVVIASQHYPMAAKYIHDKAYALENQALLNLAGFIALALAIWVIAAIVGVIVAYFANKNDTMGLISRLAGLGLSAGKYFLLFSVIMLSVLKISLIRDNITPKLDLNTSIVYPYMEQYGNEVLALNEMRVFDSKNFENTLKVIDKKSKNDTTEIISETNSSTEEINTISVQEQ